MLVGNKGVRYGLIKNSNLFSADDEEVDVAKKIQEEEAYKRQTNKVCTLKNPYSH